MQPLHARGNRRYTPNKRRPSGAILHYVDTRYSELVEESRTILGCRAREARRVRVLFDTVQDAWKALDRMMRQQAAAGRRYSRQEGVTQIWL